MAKTTLGGVELGDPRVRGGLAFSFAEGCLSSGMVALNETFAVAAAVSLGASPVTIALLGSLPLLLGYVGLYLAPALVDPARGRRLYVVLGARAQALLLFLCAFLGWIPAPWAPYAFAAAFIAGAVSGNAIGAFWVAWMGDLVPAGVRGRHWAWRSRWFSGVSLSCSLGAGFLARGYDTDNAPWIFFFSVFAASAAMRWAAAWCLARQYEPPAAEPLEIFSPLSFRPKPGFLPWSLSNACFQGSAILAAPFFTVWYLRDLHFNYLWLATASSAHVAGSLLSLKAWGRMVDRAGSAKVLRLSLFLACFSPLPSLFLENPAALCLANAYAGATWSGFGLAGFGRTMSLTDAQQRHHYIAFHSLVIGIAGTAFGLLGGFLASRLPPLFGWNLRSLFLLSAALRMGVWLAYFRRLRDPSPQPAPAGPAAAPAAAA